MYNCNEAMYNKAEIYYKAATNLKDNGFINEALIIEVQIAIECYLCNILEMFHQTDCDHIFNNEELIPHDGLLLYRKIYPYGKDYHPTLPKFSVELKNLLASAFKDYSSLRFPKDNETIKGSRAVSSEDILDDFNLMQEVKTFADQFREKYFELENELEVTNEK